MAVDPSDSVQPNSYQPTQKALWLEHKLEESASRKKPMNADCKDLERLWEVLRDEINHSKKEVLLDMKDNIGAIRNSMKATESTIQQCIADAAEGLRLAQIAQDSCDKEAESNRKQLDNLGSDVTAQLHTGLSNLDAQLQHLCSEAQKVSVQHGSRLESLQAAVDNQASQYRDMCQSSEASQKSMERAMATLRRSTSDTLAECSKENVEACERLEATMIERFREIMSEAAHSNAEIQKKLSNATDTVFHSLDTKLDQAMHSQKVANQEGREQLRHDCKSEIEYLQKELLHLSRAVSSVANIPTRRVEWMVRDASTRFRCSSLEDLLQPGDDVSVTSRKFEVAGSRGLQLEIVRFGGTNSEGSDNRDCALRLTAEKGLRLLFRISLGDVVHQLEHTFDGDRPFVTGRLCMLMEQIRQDDTLRVGLEILEACTQVESTSSLASMGLQQLDPDELVNDSSTFVFHRYLNHRMLDLVQDQVDVMNSRMTRRVEWRIDHASKLANVFSEGETMCSTVFQAAGLDGLQFVFYPSGSFGVKEGFCSCFLYYPGRSALRCWLSVGSFRRDAKLSVTSPGFFGRTNFCKLEQGIDAASDAVSLVLEIEQAHQDVTKNAVVSGSGDASFESVLKLQKTSGHLQEVKQLPSIWTPTPQVANSVDGFHNIKDLASKRRPKQGADHSDICKGRPATVSSMSMYSHSDGDAASRPESRQRPGSRLERALSPDRQRAISALSMHSEMQPCPPASARPMQRAVVRDALSARYAAYMT